MRNINDALIDVLRRIDENGLTVVTRGQEQVELLADLIHIDSPWERVLAIPGRNNNIFAQIAETIWVLSGRDDLEFLSNYLPRAYDFSDDGVTWRAAYGPRLRSWGGSVDQIRMAVNRLIEDPFTKRSIISIYDPGADFVTTKDVPCNNWLQFIQRDGFLHLHVTVRANDAVWGFSGINFFEWSVLHEIVARTLGWKQGRISWFVGTFHVYERHYSLAKRILRNQLLFDPYELGYDSLPIETGLDGLDEVLARVLEVERIARADDIEGALECLDTTVKDQFFAAAGTLLIAYNALKGGVVSAERAATIVARLPKSDLRLAAMEFLTRKHKVNQFPQMTDEEKFYLDAFRAAARRSKPLFPTVFGGSQ